MRSLVLVAAVLSLACPPKPPEPTPTPTPTPGPVVQYPELLLRQSGGVLTRGGLPHKFKQCIPCWDPLELDHGGWTGVSKAWVDYSTAQGNCNAGHIRLGPFVKDAPDVTWRGTGALNEDYGPYVNDDAAQGFDQSWWDRLLSQVEYAESKGWNLEIDLIDGWGCKHAIWGDITMPWADPDVRACGNVLTETHKAFLRKAVETLGCHGGVIWSDGNEISNTPNVGPFRVSERKLVARQPIKFSPQWTLTMVDYVRQLEQEVGCGVVHMFGSNSERDEVNTSPKIDYTSVHNGAVITGPEYGKWRLNNERNPPGSPAEECAAHCTAERAGQAWAYWRGAQSKGDMDATLACMKDCSAPPQNLCPDPKPNPADLRWKVKPSGAWWDPTPLVTRNCAYCSATEQGDGGTRCECPARVECPGWQCESRVACEQVLMQAPYPVWRGDGRIEIESNGWRARCPDCSWLEVCNGPQTNCARAF